MALLATRRYLTKAEIFATVAGYEGKIETQERMFERDKDDLRSMGIEIEVGNLDPFFEDEPGYKISASSYALTLNDLSSTDVALLSLAAGLWHQSALSENSMSALRKLKSLGIPADFSAAGVLEAKFEEPAEYFDTILEAISDCAELNFNYRSSSTKLRKVHPYTLTLWNGSWYLIAQDLDAGELRTFKLARIIDSVERRGKKRAFTIPADFTAHHSLFREESAQRESAKIKIRKEDIVEVNSKHHLPLQFLDIILGSIQFRLNNKHKEKPLGKKRRGKKTIAKEKLYKHINKKIRETRKGFNVGVTTGAATLEERWSHSYRHWCFVPKDYEIDESLFK